MKANKKDVTIACACLVSIWALIAIGFAIGYILGSVG